MSLPPAGTSKKGLFSQQDYLAPLPIPTGEKPVDRVNMIWRKNEVFLDIGNLNVGGAVISIWFMSLMFLVMGYYSWNDRSFYIFMVGTTLIIGIPTLIFIYSLIRATPFPVRFNRQRREVCVTRKNGEYWIVPWEMVTAAAAQHSSISQAGRTMTGLLFVGFDNPNSLAAENDKNFMLGFNCGGNKAAMSQWECIRCYMEIGSHALPQGNDFENGRATLKDRGVIWGVCCEYANGIWQHMREGEFLKAAWLFTGIFIFGGPIVFMLQTWKLSPPPTLDHPDIIEWSKSLPPEQWAKRSPELELAIAAREAELAARSL